ncbi:thiamine-phosphate kinase, partial [Desulfovibrio sp. OttesenSCG-928-O18]|nr:thiamine-phosphate kinase [Desulfovibrio sp. OttesenSCG-928-O18]
MNNRHIESEDDFLALIAATFPNSHPSLVLGRGDDCAEIACPPQMAVSTDLFVEDIHFRRAYFSPFEIGYKALAVNISDIAAAGAKPLGVSVGLVVPVPFPYDFAQELVHGLADAAKRHGLALTGGDLSRGDKISLCVTIWGAPSGKQLEGEPQFLRRGPVAPGDTLFVCGRIGLARAGLLSFERHGRDFTLQAYPNAAMAHLMPKPLVDAGLKLANVPNCRLMDVSDGLMRDLPRMLRAYGADCGAEIAIPENALHAEAKRFAESLNEDPAHFAFRGG